MVANFYIYCGISLISVIYLCIVVGNLEIKLIETDTEIEILKNKIKNISDKINSK